jgi:hypothetical protein
VQLVDGKIEVLRPATENEYVENPYRLDDRVPFTEDET